MRPDLARETRLRIWDDGKRRQCEQVRKMMRFITRKLPSRRLQRSTCVDLSLNPLTPSIAPPPP
ncbi:hypothetical protein KC354_g169, partial [Hortaea werneckii]